MNPERALEELRQGNKRFIQGAVDHSAMNTTELRKNLLNGQTPFATILGCSDSRAPAEIIFDQTLGDLFVVRVAGNVVNPSQLGSIEFAAQQFGTSLVVVMGHSDCGAVKAAIDQFDDNQTPTSPHVLRIVDCIKPAIAPLVQNPPCDNLIEHAVDANIRASVDHIVNRSELLQRLLDEQKIKIVGAKYHLESGEVVFFDSGVG